MRGYPIQTRWWGISVFCWRRHEPAAIYRGNAQDVPRCVTDRLELHIQQPEASSTGVASKSSGEKVPWVSMRLQYSGSGSLTRLLCTVRW
jgi:hypothetical protein